MTNYKGNFVINKSFSRLNKNEKIPISYYRQSLTHLFAERFLNIRWTFHLDDYKKHLTLNRTGTVIPNSIFYNTTKAVENSDLIGLSSRNRAHILEAKG